jgi:RimJ/RimL family protein N-acetyltransferase
VSLSVAIDNPRARVLYERCGYVVTGEPYDDHWEFINAAGQRVAISEKVLDLVKDLA